MCSPCNNNNQNSSLIFSYIFPNQQNPTEETRFKKRSLEKADFIKKTTQKVTKRMRSDKSQNPISNSRRIDVLRQKELSASKNDLALINYILGFVYEKERLFSEAFCHYRTAANNGSCDALYRLGHLYETGRGTEKSDLEAIKYYNTAAKKGHLDALAALSLLKLKSTQII